MIAQNLQLKESNKELNQEQENLLTLLQEMEEKMKNYKQILKKYGHNFAELSGSDEEEENDDAIVMLKPSNNELSSVNQTQVPINNYKNFNEQAHLDNEAINFNLKNVSCNY